MAAGTRRQVLAGVIASISVMCLGVSMGWSSPIIQKFTHDSPIQPPPTENQISSVIAFLEIGNLLTPVPSGILVDLIGRKNTLVCIGPLYIVSWVIMYYFHKLLALYIGRIIQGMACGIIYTAVPIYLGEISSPELRGAICNLFQGLMYIGLLYSYIIGPYVSYNTFNLFCLALPIVYTIAVIFIPETPYYLLMRKKENRANKVLRLMRDSSNVEEEITIMKDNVDKEMENSSHKDVFKTASDVKLFVIVQCLGAMQIMSNMYSILAYASKIFQEGNQLLTPDQYAILLGFITCISTFPSALLVDTLGRKPLLVISSVLSGLLEALTGIYFLLREMNVVKTDDYSWCVVVLVSALSFCYSFGLGPLVPTVQCELFPTNTKGLAFGITILVATVTASVNIKQFQIIADHPALGMSYNFFFGSIVCFVIAVFVSFCLPETKGRTLAEIQLIFHNRNNDVQVIMNNS